MSTADGTNGYAAAHVIADHGYPEVHLEVHPPDLEIEGWVELAPPDMPPPSTRMVADALAERNQIVANARHLPKATSAVGKLVAFDRNGRELRGVVRSASDTQIVVSVEPKFYSAPNVVDVIDRVRDKWRFLFP